MYSISHPQPDQINLSLDGKLDAQGMRDLLDELLEMSRDMKDGKMLYTINEFKMPEFAALVVEMRYLPRMFSLLSRIDRVAVISDVEWIKKAALVEGKLLPGLTIATFNKGQEAAAQAYLDGLDEVA